jgi:hypothetical protein
MFLFGDGIEQCSIVSFSIEKPVDELFGVPYIGVAADHVIGMLSLAVFGDDAFHLVF